MPKYRISVFTTETNDYAITVEATDEDDAIYIASKTPATNKKWDWFEYIDVDAEHEVEEIPSA